MVGEPSGDSFDYSSSTSKASTCLVAIVCFHEIAQLIVRSSFWMWNSSKYLLLNKILPKCLNVKWTIQNEREKKLSVAKLIVSPRYLY